jgi:hypothetical protein
VVGLRYVGGEGYGNFYLEDACPGKKISFMLFKAFLKMRIFSYLLSSKRLFLNCRTFQLESSGAT